MPYLSVTGGVETEETLGGAAGFGAAGYDGVDGVLEGGDAAAHLADVLDAGGQRAMGAGGAGAAVAAGGVGLAGQGQIEESREDVSPAEGFEVGALQSVAPDGVVEDDLEAFGSTAALDSG